MLPSTWTSITAVLVPVGKVNSSVNRRLSSSTRNAPSRINRPTNDSRPRRSAVYTAAEQHSTKALHHQARKISETECAKKSTPLKRAESVSFQPTPSKRPLEKTASMPSSASSLLPGRLKSKPEALVFPTPGVRHTDGNRLQSCTDERSMLLTGLWSGLTSVLIHQRPPMFQRGSSRKG